MGKEQLRHCIQRQLAIQVRDAVCIGKQHHFPIKTSAQLTALISFDLAPCFLSLVTTTTMQTFVKSFKNVIHVESVPSMHTYGGGWLWQTDGIGTIGVLPFMLRATIVQLQYISCNLKALQEQKKKKKNSRYHDRSTNRGQVFGSGLFKVSSRPEWRKLIRGRQIMVSAEDLGGGKSGNQPDS